MKIRSFIFSDKNQEDVNILRDQLANLTKEKVVVGDNDKSINEQFLQAIDSVDVEDFLLFTRSDIKSVEWERFLKDSIDDFKVYNWGVYTLNINSFYNGVTVEKISNHLTRVSYFDISLCIIQKEIIKALKQLNLNWLTNSHGIGINSIISSLCVARKKLTIKNNNYNAVYEQDQISSLDVYKEDYFNLCAQLPNFLRRIIINNDAWA